MVKFLFTRMEEPESPSLNGGRDDWSPTGDIRDRMWSTMWTGTGVTAGRGRRLAPTSTS